MTKKIIGILGGMGPAATADLFSKIIVSTKAANDQEHLHVIIDSNTSIPDRTEALIHGGEDPTEQLTLSARRLSAAQKSAALAKFLESFCPIAALVKFIIWVVRGTPLMLQLLVIYYLELFVLLYLLYGAN